LENAVACREDTAVRIVSTNMWDSIRPYLAFGVIGIPHGAFLGRPYARKRFKKLLLRTAFATGPFYFFPKHGEIRSFSRPGRKRRNLTAKAIQFPVSFG
jgi:hypothetical protein